jgi:hypothetical protein
MLLHLRERREGAIDFEKVLCERELLQLQSADGPSIPINMKSSQKAQKARKDADSNVVRP